jgi:hypothetical protein
MALAKEGQRVKLAVPRRILFEGRRPIAVQDSCRAAASVLPSLSSAEAGAALPAQESRFATNPLESAHFAERLKQLNRLSSTRYDSMEPALKTT